MIKHLIFPEDLQATPCKVSYNQVLCDWTIIETSSDCDKHLIFPEDLQATPCKVSYNQVLCDWTIIETSSDCDKHLIFPEDLQATPCKVSYNQVLCDWTIIETSSDCDRHLIFPEDLHVSPCKVIPVLIKVHSTLSFMNIHAKLGPLWIIIYSTKQAKEISESHGTKHQNKQFFDFYLFVRYISSVEKDASFALLALIVASCRVV